MAGIQQIAINGNILVPSRSIVNLIAGSNVTLTGGDTSGETTVTVSSSAEAGDALLAGTQTFTGVNTFSNLSYFDQIEMATSRGITSQGGTANLDFSASTGLFKSPSGLSTINGALTLADTLQFSTLPVIASASTIAPVTAAFRLSGTAAIDTITVPTDFSTRSGVLYIVATGNWSVTTAGNIGTAFTAVSGLGYTLVYDTASSKWRPSAGATNASGDATLAGTQTFTGVNTFSNVIALQNVVQITGSDITINGDTNITAGTAGAGIFDLSAQTGTFNTSSGINFLNGASTVINGGPLRLNNVMVQLVNGTLPTIASASTIAPTTVVFRVSGTTQINTITVPAGLSTNSGYIHIVPTGAFAFGTSGNISIAMTATVGELITLVYDTVQTKWIPSSGTSSGFASLTANNTFTGTQTFSNTIQSGSGAYNIDWSNSTGTLVSPSGLSTISGPLLAKNVLQLCNGAIPTIASSTTITAPTGLICLISGGTVIQTVTPPAAYGSNSGFFISLPAAGATWATNLVGNVATLVSGKASNYSGPILWVYNTTDSKWYTTPVNTGGLTYPNEWTNTNTFDVGIVTDSITASSGSGDFNLSASTGLFTSPIGGVLVDGPLKLNNTMFQLTAGNMPTIASASTIAPTTVTFRVSGTTQINTITVPAGLSTNAGIIWIVPTGNFTLGTSGNILTAVTAVTGQLITLIFDNVANKWVPIVPESGAALIASNNTWTGTNTFNNTVTIGANRNLTAAAGTGVFDFSASSGAFSTSSGTNTISGAANFAKTINFSSFPSVVSATSIPITVSAFSISADNDIATFATAGSFFATNPGVIFVLALDDWATTTAGNISEAFTAVANQVYIFIYNTGDSKWYPIIGASGFASLDGDQTFGGINTFGNHVIISGNYDLTMDAGTGSLDLSAATGDTKTTSGLTTVSGDLALTGFTALYNANVPTIASAGTIAPASQVFFLSGNQIIANITVPAGLNGKPGFVMILPSPGASWSFATAGNIATEALPGQNQMLLGVYDPGVSKWYFTPTDVPSLAAPNVWANSNEFQVDVSVDGALFVSNTDFTDSEFTGNLQLHSNLIVGSNASGIIADAGSTTLDWSAGSGAITGSAAGGIVSGGRLTASTNLLLTNMLELVGTTLPTIASATSITPTTAIFRLSGTTTVNTIDITNIGSNPSVIFVLPTGAVPFGTSGNISAAFTATAGSLLIFAYDPVAAKWQAVAGTGGNFLSLSGNSQTVAGTGNAFSHSIQLTGVTSASAAADYDLSASSGAFKTTTGTTFVGGPLQLHSMLQLYNGAIPAIASASTIAPISTVVTVSGTATINTITVPAGASTNPVMLIVIPSGAFSTGTSGNIAQALTASVDKPLIFIYDTTDSKWKSNTGSGSLSLTASNQTVSGTGNAFSASLQLAGVTSASGAYSYDLSGSTSTFLTPTGQTTVGGNLVIAANKNLSMAAGAGTATIDFTNSNYINLNNMTMGGFFLPYNQVAPNVLAASTISASAPVLFLSGSATINTITPPTYMNNAATTGILYAFNNGGSFAFAAGGNIARACKPPDQTGIIFIYDGGAGAGLGTWYPLLDGGSITYVNNTWAGTQTFSNTVTFGANVAVSAASGTGSFDLSSATGIFKSSSGANQLSGDVTISAGKNVTMASGSGIFDISAATGTAKVTNLLVKGLTSLVGGALSSVSAASTIAPTVPVFLLTGSSTNIDTITVPSGFGSNPGILYALVTGSGIATTAAGNIATAQSLVQGSVVMFAYDTTNSLWRIPLASGASGALSLTASSQTVSGSGNAFSNSIQLAGITSGSGAFAYDLSASSGVTKTTTGAFTHGGNVGFASGVTFTMGAGSGAFDVSGAAGVAVFTSAQFKGMVQLGNGIATIASAATIAPTTLISRITGNTPIDTITVPSSLSTNPGYLYLIPTNGLPLEFTAAGNIVADFVVENGAAVLLVYDTSAAKWIPVTAGGNLINDQNITGYVTVGDYLNVLDSSNSGSWFHKDLRVDGRFNASNSSSAFDTSTGTNTIWGAAVFNSTAHFTGNVTASTANSFDWSASSTTFKTSTGTVTLAGTTVVAANKDFGGSSGTGSVLFATSSGTFETTTGAVKLNGHTTLNDAKFVNWGQSCPAISAASTIAPTTPTFSLSGATVVNTITAPTGISFNGQLLMIATGSVSWSASGNIKVAGSAVAGQVVYWLYNGNDTKWYNVSGQSAGGVFSLSASSQTITGTGTTFSNDLIVNGGITTIGFTTNSILGSAGAGTVDLSALTGGFQSPKGPNILSDDVTISANKSLSLASGTGNANFQSSTGTFDSTVGANTLRGHVSVASGKNLTMSSTGFLRTSWTTSISAAGSDQSGATAITTPINNVTTVSSGTGVKLPTSTAGDIIVVMNSGANTLKVYPFGSETVNGGTDPVTIGVGSKITFQAIASTTGYVCNYQIISGTKNLVIPTVNNQGYYFWMDVGVDANIFPAQYTIDSCTLVAGTIGTAGTYTVGISGFDVTGLAGIVPSTTRTTTAATSTNIIVPADFVLLSFSGTVGVTNLYAQLNYHYIKAVS